MESATHAVRDCLAQLNNESRIDEATPRLGIVLAAGHGKRIRSETSKMLHEIWGSNGSTRSQGHKQGPRQSQPNNRRWHQR